MLAGLQSHSGWPENPDETIVSVTLIWEYVWKKCSYEDIMIISGEIM